MSEDDDEKYLDQFNEPAENAYTWLRKRGYLDAKCPVCGTADWLEETRTDPKSSEIDYNAPVFAMKDPRSFFGPAPAIPTLAFTCSECGFLRQHNISWLNRKDHE